jgi:hypothetical protein
LFRLNRELIASLPFFHAHYSSAFAHPPQSELCNSLRVRVSELERENDELAFENEEHQNQAASGGQGQGGQQKNLQRLQKICDELQASVEQHKAAAAASAQEAAAARASERRVQHALDDARRRLGGGGGASVASGASATGAAGSNHGAGVSSRDVDVSSVLGGGHEDGGSHSSHQPGGGGGSGARVGVTSSSKRLMQSVRASAANPTAADVVSDSSGSARAVFGMDASSSSSSSSQASTPVVTPLATAHHQPRSGIPAIALPAPTESEPSSSSPSSPSENGGALTKNNLCAQCRLRAATEAALREDISDLESSLTAAQVNGRDPRGDGEDGSLHTCTQHLFATINRFFTRQKANVIWIESISDVLFMSSSAKQDVK